MVFIAEEAFLRYSSRLRLRVSLVRAHSSLLLSLVLSAASLASLTTLSSRSLALSTVFLSILSGLSSARAVARETLAKTAKRAAGLMGSAECVWGADHTHILFRHTHRFF